MQDDSVVYTECGRTTAYKTQCEGRVVVYNLTSGESEVKLKGLYLPNSITSFTNSTTRLYFVSEFETNKILVYNKTWDLVNAIGGRGRYDGQMVGPRKIIISPLSTLWVVDYYNNRVSEFSLEGRWIRHVLVLDGELSPIELGVSKQYPQFIWVSYFKVPRYEVKRFRISHSTKNY